MSDPRCYSLTLPTVRWHLSWTKVRHNDYDRAPLDYLSNDDVDRFYDYHKSLSAIIR